MYVEQAHGGLVRWLAGWLGGFWNRLKSNNRSQKNTTFLTRRSDLSSFFWARLASSPEQSMKKMKQQIHINHIDNAHEETPPLISLFPVQQHIQRQ
ncbi:hypothetical protein VTN49DRAFT_4177 [Thermomyces lanuginosus]|uniref:uncharacterized protein n=1 Tax=Thermomyces lanuginosus TaxID=5541 RepID=UPI0037437D32